LLDKIRLATPEEVKEIEYNSNLTPTCRVLKMGEMTAVWRVANEIDPLHPNGASTQKMYRFLWGMENILRGAGATEYYYNIDAADTTYHKAIEEHFGAERLSKQPDYRFRVNL
jgi:hypothetical protein